MRQQIGMKNVSLSTEEKSRIIKRHLELIIEKEKAKATSDIYFDKFKSIWASSKYSRLAIGLGISAGVTISTLTGSFAIAGGLLLSRAILGSIGGFMATQSVFEIIDSRFCKNPFERILDETSIFTTPEEIEKAVERSIQDIITDSKEDIEIGFLKAKEKINSKKRMKMVLGATSAVVMGILGGSRLAEAAASMSAGTESLTAGISSKINDILDSSSKPGKIDEALMRDIFSDIRSDHPSQGYVTLEQAERRIAGLKGGIGLDESVRLDNNGISKSIRESGSGIMKAMKDLGYIDDGSTFEKSASSLSEGEISEILIKAHDNDIIAGSGKTLEKGISYQVPDMVTSERGLGHGIPSGINEDRSWITKTLIGTAAIIGICIGGKKLNEKISKPLIPQIGLLTDIPTALADPVLPVCHAKRKKPTVEKTEDMNKKEPIDIRLAETKTEEKEIQEERMSIITDISSKGFGFSFEKIVELEDCQMLVFTKKTVGGHFAMLIKEYEDTVSVDFIWYDHGIEKNQLSGSFRASRDRSDFEDLGKMAYQAIYQLFRETIRQRDEIKCIEVAKYWHTIKISRYDLSLIYRQSDHPEILKRGAETGGFWYQNNYGFHDGILEMRNLQNPCIDEMDIRSLSFSIKPEDDIVFEWNLRKFIKARESQFDAFESKIMWDILKDGIHKNGQWNMSGCSFSYNWHKHPGNLYHPSSDDLSRDGSACIVDLKNHLNQMTYSWGILNHLPPHINEKGKPENSIILRGKDYGGSNDYIMYFWRINRNSKNSYCYDDLIPIKAIVKGFA